MAWLRAWGWPVALGLMAVGIVVNFALLIPLIGRVAAQSSQGSMARDTQVRRQPVADKVYTDAFHRHVITAADLACFRDSSKCPRAKP